MSCINPMEMIKPLKWLMGKWYAISAKGHFPTIKSFEYNEDLEFKFFGQPMLQYSSKTYLIPDKKPMHYESGFLRIKPGTNCVALLAAHNFGITSLEEGRITENELKLKSVQIARMHFGREPAVCKIERHFKLCGEDLHMVLNMETTNTPLTEHLRVVYRKC